MPSWQNEQVPSIDRLMKNLSSWTRFVAKRWLEAAVLVQGIVVDGSDSGVWSLGIGRRFRAWLRVVS